MKMQPHIRTKHQLRSRVACVLAGVALPFAGSSQVVIEGGPAEVQISDRDGEAEGAIPGDNIRINPAAPSVAPPDRENEAVTIRPVPNSDVTVRVPIQDEPETQSENTEVSEVTATQKVEPPEMVMDPETAKKLAKLERQLNIDKYSMSARTAFRANNVFEGDTNQIDELAEPTLIEFAEYLKLLEGDEVEVVYHYVPAEETSLEAREKATTFVNWLAKEEQLQNYAMTVESPREITGPTPVSGRSGGITTDTFPFLEVVVAR